MELIFLLIALIAGIVQGLTGFGAGIVMMMFLPMIFPITASAGISVCISIVLLISMVYTYRKYINLKLIVIPAVIFLSVITLTINLSTTFDSTIMKKIFGFFLVVLSIYYVFFNKNNTKKVSLLTSLFCIMVSAICDGLFGIGGPLMVLYFMSITKSVQEYLGTIQCFFLINCLYTTVLRIIKGILLAEHISIVIIGMIGITIGGQLSKKLITYLDVNFVKKITYLMIGISGFINIL